MEKKKVCASKSALKKGKDHLQNEKTFINHISMIYTYILKAYIYFFKKAYNSTIKKDK